MKTVDVPLRDLPPALQGFRIAQISDLHVGPTIKRAYLRASSSPSTRSTPTSWRSPATSSTAASPSWPSTWAPLRDLRSRHGSFFVTGNHEYYSGAGPWIEELRRLGVRVLMNEHVVLRHGQAPLVLAGVADYTAHHFEPSHRSDPHMAIAGAPRAAVKVLLAHQPPQRERRRRRRLPPAVVRAHARRPVPALELLRALPAAVHRRPARAEGPARLHEPRQPATGVRRSASARRRRSRTCASSPPEHSLAPGRAADVRMAAMKTVHHPLVQGTPGARLELLSLHYGTPGAGPKATLQAALHADEIPGLLVAHHLRERLAALEAEGRIRGEVVLVPVANPIGLGQRVLQSVQGRFELASGENFNRHYADLFETVAAHVDGRSGRTRPRTSRSSATRCAPPRTRCRAHDAGEPAPHAARAQHRRRHRARPALRQRRGAASVHRDLRSGRAWSRSRA